MRFSQLNKLSLYRKNYYLFYKRTIKNMSKKNPVETVKRQNG